MHGFNPLCQRHRNLQAHRDIPRDMVTAKPDRIGVDHVLFHKNRHAGRAAANIDTGRAKLLLIFDQRRNPRHISRRSDARQLKIAALHAIGQIMNGFFRNGQHMHIRPQHVANLIARI